MDCPSCGHPNPPDARFCGNCAAPLSGTVECPSCGSPNPGDQRFCNSCGEQLYEDPAESPPATPLDASGRTPDHLAEKIRGSRSALEGERKQVTVLFADVTGSMDLAEHTDPEDWKRIMDGFFGILCGGVHRFEGTVDKFTGDGIMAIFGAPIAHEDHAQRACYAALHLRDELAAYASELRRTQGLNFSVRMGLNSGEVVVGAIGEDLAMEYTAVGHTVGLAQRMESLAEPGRIYVTDGTASMVGGYLAAEDLGEFRVKGVSVPMRVHELTGVGAARGRLDISRERGFSRFVGRSDEMWILESAIERAQAGEAQVIGIVGEAGVGKSRLCHEFSQRARARGTPVYHVAAHAHTKSVPLVPVLQYLRDYFDVSEQDTDQTARERIAGKLLLLDEAFADDLPLIFDFMGVPDPQRPPTRMDPEARQRQLMALTKRLTRARSDREAAVNVFEDLHWVDPASEVFLQGTIEAVQGTRTLVVANFRPEYHAAWMSKSYYRQIALAPLGPGAIEEMLADLLGSDPSVNGLGELIRRRTGGNPFFIEEVVQSLVETGNLEGQRGAYRLERPVEDAAVPASVQTVLAARIDRLAEREKAILQAAAVIGKEFSEPVLGLASGLDEAELEGGLRELVDSEFVYEQELYPETVYAFKHPLTQEVAYGSQLGRRRAEVHATVAKAIIERYPELLDERAALIAQHWDAAGEALEAARWHARAATWAGTTDPAQSLAHWRQVRGLADSLPESSETVALGLTARNLMLQFGWRLGISSEEVEALFTDAERLASRAGDIHARAILLSGYGQIKCVSEGDLSKAAELGRQAIALAEESGDPELFVAMAGTSAYNLFCIGEYAEALALMDRAIDLAHGDPTVGAGGTVACPHAFNLFFKGGLVAGLGNLVEGRRLVEEGMKIADEQGDIETVGWSHSFHGWIAYFMEEADAVLRDAQAFLDIAERLGDSFSRSWAWLWVGWAKQQMGDWEQAIEAIDRSAAISAEHRSGVEADVIRFAALAQSYAGLGELERARALAEQAIAVAEAGRGQFQQEIEARLALARILFAERDPALNDAIEASLTRALEVAAKGVKAYEPIIRLEIAELASRRGDEGERERELREAQRLFAEIGAVARADRVADELALLPG